MFDRIKNWFTESKPTARDLSYEEIVEQLRTKSDLEIFARLRFRDRWVQRWHEQHRGATVPSGFLMRFGALDKVASERILKLMNEQRVLRELPEHSKEKLEKWLWESYPENLK